MDFLENLSDKHHKWKLIQTIYDDSLLIIRANVTAEQWIGNPDLPIKLGFAVPLRTTSQAIQMPLPEENEQLNNIEDIIRKQVKLNTHGIHVLVLTTSKMREFVFYVATGSDIKNIHELVKDAVSTHEVQCQAVRETTWISYKKFTVESR